MKEMAYFICALDIEHILLLKCIINLILSALKSSPSKRGRGGLAAAKYSGPGAAWSASQLPFVRDENIYDLRGARSFPTLEDDGKQ